MGEDFQISISAKLAPNSLTSVRDEIKKIEEDSVKITVDTKEAEEKIRTLKNQIDSLSEQPIKLNIENRLNNSSTTSIKQAGVKVASQLSDSINKNIKIEFDNSGHIEKFGESLERLGIDSTAIENITSKLNELDLAITSISQKGEIDGQLLSVGVVGKSEEEGLTNVIKLTETFNRKTGEFQKTSYDLKTTFDKQTKSVSEQTETSSKYSKSLDESTSKAKNFADSQAKVAARLSNTLKTIQSEVDDKNVSKPILDKSNLEALEPKYTKIKEAIETVRTADESTATQAKINAESLISSLKDEIKTYRNAESAAAKLREKEAVTFTKSDNINTAKTDENLNKIKSSIYNSKGYSEYQNKITNITQDLQKYGATAEEVSNVTEKMNTIFSGMKAAKDSGDTTYDFESNAAELEAEFKSAKVAVDSFKLSFDAMQQPASDSEIRTTLVRIQDLLTNNTRATAETKAQWVSYMQELSSGAGVTKARLQDINLSLKEQKSEMRMLNRLGKSLTDQWKQGVATFTSWLSASQAVMAVINKTKEAVNELKEVDTYITEISKANDSLTDEQLKSIASSSFSIAGKYGKTSTDYLAAVQEMSRAGYKDAEGLSELSVAAQGAGDMTADLANQYIIATDKAYGFEGSVEKLNSVLDGANYITNNNAVNMMELAEGMSIVGSQAASSGMEVDETTAALGTMIAVTQQSGSRMANAFKGILMNIQQVTGEVDGEEIDTDSLTKYEQACADLGVALSEVKDGIVSLRDPMTIIKELSDAYTALDESDAKRANLLSSVGGKTYLYVQKCA